MNYEHMEPSRIAHPSTRDVDVRNLEDHHRIPRPGFTAPGTSFLRSSVQCELGFSSSPSQAVWAF